MEFQITIYLLTEAMRGKDKTGKAAGAEIAKILRDLADRIEVQEAQYSYELHDSNDKFVGQAKYKN